MLISPDCSKDSFEKNYFEIRISQLDPLHCTKYRALDNVLDTHELGNIRVCHALYISIVAWQ